MPTVVGQMTGLGFVQASVGWTTNGLVWCCYFLSFTPDSLVVIVPAESSYQNSAIVLVVGLGAAPVGGRVDVAG